MPALHQLEQALCYTFHDQSLLSQALTHPSHGKKNNQRLEFLGDSVLQLVISNRLYSNYRKVNEGILTQMRQKLVCEQALANVATTIHLGDYLIMDKGCALAGGRTQNSVLADAMEAVLAAVFLDEGFEAASQVIDKLFVHKPEQESDAKSALQEYLQAKGKPLPTYQTIKEQGPAHAPQFTVSLQINGVELTQGTQCSKKKAEQEAAKLALEHYIKHDGNTP